MLIINEKTLEHCVTATELIEESYEVQSAIDRILDEMQEKIDQMKCLRNEIIEDKSELESLIKRREELHSLILKEINSAKGE